jgi:hypothetical protein
MLLLIGRRAIHINVAHLPITHGSLGYKRVLLQPESKSQSSFTTLLHCARQEFSLSAETEYSAAKNHRIFGTFTSFRPKVIDLLHTHSKIDQIRTKFDDIWCLVFPDLSIIT